MIGLGKWSCHVDTMFFRGEAFFTIKDNNGEYGWALDVPGVDVPEIVIRDITEDGNTLTAVANVDMLPGKDINITATFEGDTVEGLIKIPFIGKIKLKDGKKVAM
ncbi:MAG: hypothetical protein WCN92_04000 [Eubacteriales bacterium]